MSLIVARNTRDSIYIVSDTRLSPRPFREVAPNPFGAIKIQLINQGLAIGFAGDVGFAESALHAIHLADDCSVDSILARLADIHKQSGQQTEFLLASLDQDRSLYQIKEGIIQNTNAAFIGSSPAFERYQKHWHSSTGTPEASLPGSVRFQARVLPEKDESRDDNVVSRDDSSLYFRMFNCMAAVISDAGTTEVNGHVVAVCTHRGALRYMFYTTTTTHPQDFSDLRPGQQQRVGFGTAAQGGYSFHFSELEGAPGCGMYWQQGQCGVIFFRDNTDGLFSPHWLSNVSPLDYVEICQQRYALRVHTACLNEGSYWRRAKECIEAGLSHYAIEYLEEAIERIKNSISKLHIALREGRGDQVTSRSLQAEFAKLKDVEGLKAQLLEKQAKS